MSSPNAKSCHSPNSSSVGVTAPSDNCEKCENKSLKLQPTSTSVEVSHSTQKEEQIQEDFTHPLDDLTDREIKVAVQLIKAELGYPKRLGFCQLRLNEPSKQAVLDFDAGIYKVCCLYCVSMVRRSVLLISTIPFASVNILSAEKGHLFSIVFSSFLPFVDVSISPPFSSDCSLCFFNLQ